jgi:hypothetical protein
MKNSIKENKIKILAKKNPQWKGVFLLWLQHDDDLDCSQLEITFHTFIKYKHLLSNEITIEYAKSLIHQNKQDKKSFLHKIKTRMSMKSQSNSIYKFNIIEAFDDKIQSILNIKKKEQFISSLKTKSYSHMFNKEIESEIGIIIDNKISIAALKHQFFNKLAKYNTSAELLASLKDFKSKNVTWNKTDYIKKIKLLNAKIISNKDDKIMIEVLDYEACKDLGSQAWCISTSRYYYDSYNRDLNRQFIFMDFNLPLESNKSMIGFTIDIFGAIKASHLKNDQRTPSNIRSSFSFEDSSDDEKISCYLNGKSKKEAFSIICNKGLIKYYDEYKLKAGEDAIFFYCDHFKNRNNVPNDYSIVYAVENSQFPMVVKLVNDKNFDITTCDNWLLRCAAKRGDIEIIKFFLENNNVNPSAADNEALYWALVNKNEEIYDILISDPRINLSSGYSRLLFESIETKDFKIIKKLLNYKKASLTLMPVKLLTILLFGFGLLLT